MNSELPELPLGITKTERGLGCGCLFLPGGLFLSGILMGLMMGERPMPDGHIGQPRSQGYFALGVLVWIIISIAIGVAWLRNNPKSRPSGIFLLVGWLFILIDCPWMVGTATSNLPMVSYVVGILGLALIIWGYRSDTADVAVPLPHATEKQSFKWGRAFVIAGGLIGTLGLFAAWPRDPTKTTSAPELTVGLAVTFLIWGSILLRRAKKLEHHEV